MATQGPLAFLCLACAAVAAAILIWFLWKRPPIDGTTKVLLLLGIAVFPVGAAMSGNIVGYQTTQERTFCGSCHVMVPYTEDSADPGSKSLAAAHARNPWFGDKNCYTCHSDYGMYGMVTTKLNGLLHVYHYYLSYRGTSLEEAKERIHLYKPYRNQACLQCHTASAPKWLEVKDHRGAVDDVKSDKVSCMGDGCHGPSHPFSKKEVPQ